MELLDVAQCCYNLTTKKLCVELQPLRVGHGATASDAPHHCDRRGLAHHFAKRWQERNDLAQTYLDEAARRMKRATTLLGDNSKRSTKPSPTYLNNRQACPGLKEEESRPCRKADRRGSLSTPATSSVKTHPVFHVSQLTSIRPDRPR